MPIVLQISTGSPTPIYRQIVDQVRKAVDTGVLNEGDRLPSVRALAELLVINPNTVTRAYGELARHGLVESKQGRGLFVARRRQTLSKEERSRRFEHALEAFLNEAHLLEFSAEEIQEALEGNLAAKPIRKRGGSNE